MTEAALTGFFTGFSLILAIGAQNAFVIRQGLLNAHIFWLCLLFSVSDATLIALGVAGFGTVVTLVPMLPVIMAIGGAIFLFYYGLLRFAAAWRGDYVGAAAARPGSLGKALMVGLALTWLNPHVYLDTLVLIGAVSTQFEPVAEKWAFGIAAAAASFVFFFGLGYGARRLAPYFQSARVWRRLDIGIGVIMWAIAARLLGSV